MRPILVLLATICVLAPAAAGAATGQTAIFYYPWWGTKAQDGKYLHWNQYGHAPPLDLSATYFPSRGPYSSAAPEVVRAQMREIAGSGVKEVISSWWGWGSPTDRRLPQLLWHAKKRHLRVAVHLEPYIGRTVESVAGDLAHLTEAGVGKVYVYKPFALDEDGWNAAIRDRFAHLELYAETTDVAEAAARGFDGVYTYDVFTVRGGTFAGLCARAHAARLGCVPAVGPGYNAQRSTRDTRIRSRKNGRTYDDMWRAAIAARPDGIAITSYNEWHEGTQIEPAKKHPATIFDRYQSYEGAYGRYGRAAERAYLDRTAYWTKTYRIAVAAATLVRRVTHALDNIG